MIKTKQTIERKPVYIGAEFSSWFEINSNAEKRTLHRKLDQLQRTEQVARDALRRRIAEIRAAKIEAKEYETALSKLGTGDDAAAIAAIKEQLSKLSFIESLRVRNGVLLAKTRLIFTDIRNGDGSRDTTRTCLGAFEIVLRFSPTRLRVHNLLFTRNNYGHWSISGGRPCLGDWNEDISRLYEKRDIYGLLNTLFHYLRSTEDGGAYMRSHEWKEQRQESLKQPAYRRGSHVIATQEYRDMVKIPAGAYGVILAAFRDGSIMVQFDDKIQSEDGSVVGHDADGAGKSGHCWRVRRSRFAVLTKTQYAKKTTVEQLSSESVLHKIDSLPDGSTLSDAIAALKV